MIFFVSFHLIFVIVLFHLPIFIELRSMSISQLNELYMEMEVLIREFSETLISELALRDELEYEKEMKNTFISLLLAVQNKRRQYHVEKKRGKAQGKSPTAGKYIFLFIHLHSHFCPTHRSILLKRKFGNFKLYK